MSRCPRCSAEAPSDAAFCPRCGQALTSVSEMETAVRADAQTPRSDASPVATPPHTPSHPSSPSGLSSSGGASIGRIASPASGGSFHGGFAPGAVIADRYRIIGLLGRGGMGEVYRADDLKLGQAVALKFLPRAYASDPSFFERFLGEVRIARQVSHPNVCRVYDIGEVDGQHFLSMEFVDGEDLSGLLKRIGRLPPAKALEIARQLCAGLAAAHAQGVLHRDLKPSNVMLDGHGRARITDFGLAVPRDDAGAREVSGTPAYMAPEMFAGRGASVQSDLYALGLVLYEIFTGKRAFDATGFSEWKKVHAERAPRPPSEISRDIEEPVERAILRCLEKDPARRPASALQLAAALPGGDPLAAALAAGETPSPEMVAAAGEAGALSLARAWAALGGFAVLLAACLVLAQYATVTGLVRPEKSPELLTERARELIRKFGYTAEPKDSAGWFTPEGDHLQWRAKNAAWPERVRDLAKLDPAPMGFYYRQSPRDLVPINTGANVSATDPPMEFSGMVNVLLDARGRLMFFRALAPQYRDAAAAASGSTPAPPAPADSSAQWASLFAESGLDFAQFKPVESKWTPQVPYGERRAWEGPRKDYPNQVFHVTAAAYQGKPVWFSVAGPWSRPTRQESQSASIFAKIAGAVSIILTLALLAGSIVMARRNLLLGRGDRKGAVRVGVAALFFGMLDWVFTAHLVPDARVVFVSFMDNLGQAVFLAAFLSLMYLALEPFVRRYMADVLISWSRLLAGNFRDPLVGRDVLFGVLAGLLLVTLTRACNSLAWWFNLPDMIPANMNRLTLGGFSGGIGAVAIVLVQMLINSLALTFLYFVLRRLLRKPWLGFAAATLLMSLLFAGEAGGWIGLALGLTLSVILFATLVRFGLVAFAAAWGTMFLMNFFSLPLRFDRWYASNLLLALALVTAAALHGFYRSLAGKSMFGAGLAE